jgi:hypothetical protein
MEQKRAVAEGERAGRGPSPCKKIPLPCKYLIKIIKKKFHPTNL